MSSPFQSLTGPDCADTVRTIGRGTCKGVRGARYESEAQRSGWTIRRLDRQIQSQFTHADAGQTHLYLNYAREHWVLPGESPPVGLILCC